MFRNLLSGLEAGLRLDWVSLYPFQSSEATAAKFCKDNLLLWTPTKARERQMGMYREQVSYGLASFFNNCSQLVRPKPMKSIDVFARCVSLNMSQGSFFIVS